MLRDKTAASAGALALDASCKSIHRSERGVDGTGPGPLVGRRDEQRGAGHFYLLSETETEDWVEKEEEKV